MRSRYTAFVVRDEAYLLASWHPSTRPSSLDLDEGLRWRSLSIVETAGGGPFDATGTVRFEARYLEDSGKGVLRERSRFVRDGGRWFYLDGDLG